MVHDLSRPTPIQSNTDNIIKGSMCPFRSLPQVLPAPNGEPQVLPVEVPCVRNCALFDTAAKGCSVKTGSLGVQALLQLLGSVQAQVKK